MPNYYVQTSTTMKIPEEKLEQAQDILDQTMEKVVDGEFELGVKVELLPKQGEIWIRGKDANLPKLEAMTKRLVEELDLPPFYFSYACTSSGDEVDAFGGGAFLVRKDTETYWIDSLSHIREEQGHIR